MIGLILALTAQSYPCLNCDGHVYFAVGTKGSEWLHIDPEPGTSDGLFCRADDGSSFAADQADPDLSEAVAS